MKLKVKLVFWLVLGCTSLSAVDSLYVSLDSLKIKPLSKMLSDGSRTRSINLNEGKNIGIPDLGEALSENGAAYIKSYGMSSLSTISTRGGNAAQTTVIWEGVNINTPTNGLVDFSLISNSLIDRADVVYGGEAAKWGSGGQGAAIHISQEIIAHDGIETSVNSSVGSYGLNRFNLKLNTRKGKWGGLLYAFSGSANNDFSYEDESTGSKSKRTNAEVNQKGVVGKSSYQINSNASLTAALWVQGYDRNIPSVINTVERGASQRDFSGRGVVKFEYKKNQWKLSVNSALIQQEILFIDPYIDLNAPNSSLSFIHQSNVLYKASPKLIVHGGLRIDDLHANSNNFDGQVNVLRAAAYGNCKYYPFSKLKIILSGRLDYSEKRLGQPVYSAEMLYKLNPAVSIKAKSGKVYRLPSLNDLYWIPGGNPLLKPEYGSSHEVGAELDLNVAPKTKIRNETSVFSKWITDWIAWSPNGTSWSAQNLDAVWSRGIETNSTISYVSKEFKTDVGLTTNYILSTVADSVSGELQQSQLIYNPIYFGAAFCQFSYKMLMVSYRHSYTGYTFTSSDNTAYLPPFDVASFGIGLRFKIDNSDVMFHYRNNNIWNKNYQRIAGQPMPLMNHLFTVKVNIQ